MTRIYHDDDVDLSMLSGRTIGVIGYGNQGRAQALNIRDSGFEPLIGNRDDRYKDTAIKDGFVVHAISHVAEKADVILMLIPDEVQPQVYESQIRSHLEAGDVLCFASGYNVFYRTIDPPAGTGAIMVAPRMIGAAVRELYMKRLGFPCLVASREEDDPLHFSIALALAKSEAKLEALRQVVARSYGPQCE